MSASLQLITKGNIQVNNKKINTPNYICNAKDVITITTEQESRKIKLNEYLIFATKNPKLLVEIDNSISYFDNNVGMDVNKELGKFFYNKNNFELAQKYIEKSYSNDIEAIDLLLNIYDFNKQFEKMAKKSEEYIDLFPTKANLYYYAAKGNNNLKKNRGSPFTLSTVKPCFLRMLTSRHPLRDDGFRSPASAP